MADIKPEQIPPEVWSAFHEAVLRYGYKPQAIAAALNAWPKSMWDHARSNGSAIILPLTAQENPDAEA